MPYLRGLTTRLTALALAVMFAVPAAAQGAGEAAPDLRQRIDAAVSRVKPALVRIRVVFTRYGEGREIKYQASGSGVIISKDGYVVTNHHVAGRATRLFCTLSTKEEIEARLVGTDPLTDIAVLQLLGDGREFPSAQFGDSDAVKVGDHVLAMGSPAALSQSVTLGIVSNTEMIVPRMFTQRGGGFRLEGEDVGSLVKWIGHDADIFGGNSGGPLVNLAGEIIGINEISMSLGGAIPGNLAKEVAQALIADGEVHRAWLGIEVQPLLKHSPMRSGVLVGTVINGSPADEAGIEPGDHLLAVHGREFNIEFYEELPEFNQFVAQLAIGQEISVTVLRDGEELGLKVVPRAREEVRPQEFELREWGITVQNISLFLAKELKRDNQDGVLITSVRPGGPAGDAKPQIQQQDILVAVDGKPVRNVEALAEITTALTEGQSDPVPALVNFERKTGDYVAVVKVGIRELEDPGLEVKKAWLPVETQVVTSDIAEQKGRPDLSGFRITEVYKGTTAAEAGLQVGDIILGVDGERLRATQLHQYEELETLIRQYPVDATTELRILRGDEEVTIPVQLARAPMLPREMAKYRDENFEFTVRDITFFDTAREKWEQDQRGVVVEEVVSGGWADIGYLGVGDLLMQIDGKPVGNVKDVQAIMEAIERAQPKAVVFRVLSGIHTEFLEIEPKWDTIEATTE